MPSDQPQVLLTGATGFVGGRLLPRLLSAGVGTRCMVRSAGKFKEVVRDGHRAEIFPGDVLRLDSLVRAMEGMDAAFYLVHSMGGRSPHHHNIYIENDLRAASNFIKAADSVGLKRIIYLGGLGEMGDSLSEHLTSRQQVGEILQSGKAQTTVLRAANIIGAGGAPFEMLRHLVERLPVMICPRWIDTRGQPIAVDNVVDYLLGCLLEPATTGLRLDIGGPEILTYRQLMRVYARVRGLKRLIFSVPVLTPRLSAYWIQFMTPVPAGIVTPLLEGLKNEVVCRDRRILELVPIRLIPMQEAICNALTEVQAGPGSLPSLQSCFYR
jgi:uncharacterized protein YbjT (DUF2867 family)